MSYVSLGLWDLALAASFILLNAGLSLAFQLGIARSLIFAAARTAVQLLLIGMVLKALFALTNPWWTLLAALIMITLAGREVFVRQDRRLTGYWGFAIGTVSMMSAAGAITVIALAGMIQPEPWYAAQFAIPVLGMMLGNTMNGVALGLNTLTTLARKDRAAIEARLALGATKWEALNHVLRAALRNALTPIVNAMAAAGVISLPGMMTGQILAGADPFEATKYQVFILFIIAGSVGLGSLAAVLLGAMRLTDNRHRLRLDRLQPPKAA